MLVTVIVSQEPEFRSLCLLKSAALLEKPQDNTEPVVNNTKPDKPLQATRASLPPDFQSTLDSFLCNCYGSGFPKPLKFLHNANTCSSVTRHVHIGEAAWGCWVHSDFKNYDCPYTTCDQFSNCRGVTTNYGVVRCVQAQYKEVIYYVWCWKNGWVLEKQRLHLPTCCSCRWFCN